MNQRGFATLEVILMIMVIGILSSIAVPRFTAVTTAANTAKIQSDLATIDTAIAIYQMQNGDEETPTLENLTEYFQGGIEPKPPTGKCFMVDQEDAIDVPAEEYDIDTVDGQPRAILGDGNTAEKFNVKKSDSSDSNG